MTGSDSTGQIKVVATNRRARRNYSIADISALVVVDFAGWAKITVPDDAINLTRWYASVSARPSARA